MGFSTDISSDAVIFFDEQNRIAKEMIYTEFEAVLDHVVGIAEFKRQTMRAAFVKINSQLNIKAAVFFTIDFDDKGYVNPSWNIPLDHLAETAGRGPNMGAGPIKLACRSQCSVSWHQRSLWDPIVDTEYNSLRLLALAVRRNRLGLAMVSHPEEQQVPTVMDTHTAPANSFSSSNIGDELQLQEVKYKEKIEAMVEEHKLRIASLKSEAQQHIEKLHVQYRAEMKKLNDSLKDATTSFAQERYKNQQIKESLDNQANEFRKVRESFQSELDDAKSIEHEKLVMLKEKYELEKKASIDTATAELKEMLEMRDVEVFYREEQIATMREEVSQLRQEKQDLIGSSADKLITRLVDSGVSFVTYQPGVESLVIPPNEIGEYLDAPEKYLAKICKVDQDLYGKWLAHFEMPVCNAAHDDGTTCGRPIAKIDKPSLFIPGESDRCSQHSAFVNKLADVIKIRESS